MQNFRMLCSCYALVVFFFFFVFFFQVTPNTSTHFQGTECKILSYTFCFHEFQSNPLDSNCFLAGSWVRRESYGTTPQNKSLCPGGFSLFIGLTSTLIPKACSNRTPHYIKSRVIDTRNISLYMKPCCGKLST